MKDELIKLYLDQGQCDHFDLSYFGEGVLVAAASAVLESSTPILNAPSSK